MYNTNYSFLKNVRQFISFRKEEILNFQDILESLWSAIMWPHMSRHFLDVTLTGPMTFYPSTNHNDRPQKVLHALFA